MGTLIDQEKAYGAILTLLATVSLFMGVGCTASVNDTKVARYSMSKLEPLAFEITKLNEDLVFPNSLDEIIENKAIPGLIKANTDGNRASYYHLKFQGEKVYLFFLPVSSESKIRRLSFRSAGMGSGYCSWFAIQKAWKCVGNI